MKYAILSTGLIAAALFLYSVYVFAVNPHGFKPVAYGFLGFAIVFFILVVIRKIMEDRALRQKTAEYSKDSVNR